jgi:hypothetical protein
MRNLLLALLILALIPTAWSYAPRQPDSFDRRIWRTDLMPALRAEGVPRMGPFELAGAWRLRSRHRDFGNYSALAVLPNGTFTALGDRNGALSFSAPDRPGQWHVRIARPFDASTPRLQTQVDAESVTLAPDHRSLIVGYEGEVALIRMTPEFRPFGRIVIPALRKWPSNRGPEAMALLRDGRLVLIGEVYAAFPDRRLHPALLFPGIPGRHERPGHFMLAMPDGFRPVELTQLPDRQLLVLGRKLTFRGFTTTISLIDLSTIHEGAIVTTREIARITDQRIRENYEGMTVTRERDGALALWLISDSNMMVWAQRTLLLKLRFRPERL